MSTDKHTLETYTTAAKAYDAHVSDPSDSPLHAYYEKPAIHSSLPNLDGLEVINLGCGNGDDAEWISNKGAHCVVGIDISPGLIDIAHEKYPHSSFMVMDMANLGFADDSFDLAYSSLAIHYLPDWVAPLKEAKRVLRPGGQFIFSCNHPVETSLEYFANDEIRGAHLGRTILQSTEEREVQGDYLVVDYGGIKPIQGTIASDYTVRYYHRPFGKMIDDILDSGFVIRKLIEPVPLPEMSIDNSEHYKQVLKIPKFAIWVLEK